MQICAKLLITQQTPKIMTSQISKWLISLSLRSSFQLRELPCYHSLSLCFFSSSKPKTSKSNPTTVAVSEYLINQHQFSPETALKASSTVPYLKNPTESDLVLSFLKESGFSKTHLEQVVKKTPKILSANVHNTIKPKIKIFQDLGFSDSDIADFISSNPWILWRSAANQIGPAIKVLKSILGSNASVSKVVKSSGPYYLTSDLDKKLVPNIELLKSFGLSSSQIIKCVFHFPKFLLNKQESIVDSVKRVDEMGFDRNSKTFLRAIRVMGWMNVETWEQKVKLFLSLGISDSDILAVFRRAPEVFGISERKIKEATKLLLTAGKFDISFVVSHPKLLGYSVERRLKPRLKVLETLVKKNLLKKRPNFYTVIKSTDPMFAKQYILPYANELGDRHDH